jgi:phosphatidate cytidylyltransferase
MTTHHARILTSLFLLAVLGIVFALGRNAVLFVLIPAACLAMHEFQSLIWPQGEERILRIAGLALTFLVLLALPVLPQLSILPLLYFSAVLSAAMLFLRRLSMDSEKAGMEPFFIHVFSFAYIPGNLVLFWFLQPLEMGLILLASFATDTGGFYAGSLWGDKKIWPTVSPKKTWAGSIGGLALCILICTFFGFFLTGRVWIFVLAGMVLNLSSQAGDFFESALKRWSGKKDSGSLLPGHGGLLDRIDSILFCAPAYMCLRPMFSFFY